MCSISLVFKVQFKRVFDRLEVYIKVLTNRRYQYLANLNFILERKVKSATIMQ